MGTNPVTAAWFQKNKALTDNQVYKKEFENQIDKQLKQCVIDGKEACPISFTADIQEGATAWGIISSAYQALQRTVSNEEIANDLNPEQRGNLKALNPGIPDFNKIYPGQQLHFGGATTFQIEEADYTKFLTQNEIKDLQAKKIFLPMINQNQSPNTSTAIIPTDDREAEQGDHEGTTKTPANAPAAAATTTPPAATATATPTATATATATPTNTPTATATATATTTPLPPTATATPTTQPGLVQRFISWIFPARSVSNGLPAAPTSAAPETAEIPTTAPNTPAPTTPPTPSATETPSATPEPPSPMTNSDGSVPSP